LLTCRRPGRHPRGVTLSRAIEEADPDARSIVAVLDGIPGAYEHAMHSLEQARDGEAAALDDF
jgi:hypothetical protein